MLSTAGINFKKIARETPILTALAVPGVAMGVARANRLNDEEYQYLKKHYRDKKKDNLVRKNAVRGLIGSSVGSLAGLGVATKIKNKYLKAVPVIAGMGTGSYYSTNRYSKKRYDSLNKVTE